MQQRSGIPLIADVEALVRGDCFREHLEYNRSFLAAHSAAMKRYGYHWGEDPLRLWSRRWEYPYVAERILGFAAEDSRHASPPPVLRGRVREGAELSVVGGTPPPQPSPGVPGEGEEASLLSGVPGAGELPRNPLRILDAGSGVTYFDYFVCDRLPQAQMICCDYDPSYAKMFEAINAATSGSRVSFKRATLQQIPLADKSVDAICCISVLEHTDRYEQILDEFARVLTPRGALVLTFDLSLDGRFELSEKQAAELLAAISRKFTVRDEIDLHKELTRMRQPSELLSTDYIRRTQPELLPWKHPLLKGLHDLMHGKGWTGGFRSKSVFCLEVRAKA